MRVLWVVAALGVAGAVRASEPAGAAIVVDEVKVAAGADGSTKVWVQGKAPLPDGAVLLATVEFKGATGLPRDLQVLGGAFDGFMGQVTQRVIPGTYTVRVAYRVSDQDPGVAARVGALPAAGVKEVYLGDPAAEKAEIEAVRTRLHGTLFELRRVFMTLAQWGHYYQHTARVGLLRGKGVLPDSARRSILAQWSRYTNEYWKEIYERTGLDFRRFQEDVFLSPFPDAGKDIGDLVATMDRWYALVTSDLYALLEEPVPAEIRAPGPFKEEEVRKGLLEAAARAATSLGDPGMDWNLVDLAQPEDGVVEGERYTSKVAKFQIEKPGAGWAYDFAGLDPSVRLRIRPILQDDRPRAVVAVEIKDFAEAESVEDLRRLLVITTQQRWPGFKKVSDRRLEIADPTMPKGVRHGHETILTTVEEGQTFQIRDYELFCRWHKRTYGVLCISPEKDFKAFEKVYETVAKSFMVLDAPLSGTPGADEADKADKAKEEGK